MLPTPIVDLDRAASVRLLLRWVQHDGGLKSRGGGGARLDDIAKAVGLSRAQLNRFLGQELNTDEEQSRADQIAQGLRPHLENRRDLPTPIKRLLTDLYGEFDEGPPPGPVVTERAVIGMRSMMADRTYAIEYVEPLFGLNMIVRQSNAHVREADGREQRGWSLALLHMPPEHVQTGEHHPVFRLIQTSRAGTRMSIQGIALARRDRLTLQGVETQQRRSFTASIELPDGIEGPELQEGRLALQGVMLGVSATRANFGCLFSLFKVPGSTLPEGAGGAAQQKFEGIHERALAATGVRNLEETVAVLQGLNIKAKADDLTRLKQRGEDSPLLSVF